MYNLQECITEFKRQRCQSMDNSTISRQCLNTKSNDKDKILLLTNSKSNSIVQTQNQRVESCSAAPYPTSQFKLTDCKKSALNRNDLMSIIRESMEKNRLCFQLNGYVSCVENISTVVWFSMPVYYKLLCFSILGIKLKKPHALILLNTPQPN